MRTQGERVLHSAAKFKFPRKHFGGFAHIQVADRIRQAKHQSNPRLEIRRPEGGHGLGALHQRFGAGEPAEFFRGGGIEQQRNIRHAFGLAHNEDGPAAA